MKTHFIVLLAIALMATILSACGGEPSPVEGCATGFGYQACLKGQVTVNEAAAAAPVTDTLEAPAPVTDTLEATAPVTDTLEATAPVTDTIVEAAFLPPWVTMTGMEFAHAEEWKGNADMVWIVSEKGAMVDNGLDLQAVLNESGNPQVWPYHLWARQEVDYNAGDVTINFRTGNATGDSFTGVVEFDTTGPIVVQRFVCDDTCESFVFFDSETGLKYDLLALSGGMWFVTPETVEELKTRNVGNYLATLPTRGVNLTEANAGDQSIYGGDYYELLRQPYYSIALDVTPGDFLIIVAYDDIALDHKVGANIMISRDWDPFTVGYLMGDLLLNATITPLPAAGWDANVIEQVRPVETAYDFWVADFSDILDPAVALDSWFEYLDSLVPAD